MKKTRKLFWKIFLWIILVLVIAFVIFYKFYFLRNPIRDIPNDNNLFVSPANWKIIAIIHQDDLKNEKTELYKEHNIVIDDWTEWFSGGTLISIMMTPLDVHFQKAPTKSKLILQEYQEWRFFNATKTKKQMRSTFQNEYNSMLFETPEWYHYRVIQIAWFVARRIVPGLKIDDQVIQWQEIWHIKLWSQVSIILDNNFDITANVWDEVIDWETIIAKKK